MVLRDRAGASSTYRFHQVKQHVQAAADRLVCVVGGPGEGKSTLAAMMLENAGDTFIHAAHFCKRTDMNRQVRASFGLLLFPVVHARVQTFWLRLTGLLIRRTSSVYATPLLTKSLSTVITRAD